jgi:hypothetical protein
MEGPTTIQSSFISADRWPICYATWQGRDMAAAHSMNYLSFPVRGTEEVSRKAERFLFLLTAITPPETDDSPDTKANHGWESAAMRHACLPYDLSRLRRRPTADDWTPHYRVPIQIDDASRVREGRSEQMTRQVPVCSSCSFPRSGSSPCSPRAAAHCYASYLIQSHL